MELPSVGTHCALKTCQRLDFLPLKCDVCCDIFCGDHIKCEDHNCREGRKDVQVPVCPLCDKPVGLKKDQTPDKVVSDHIDQTCDSAQVVKQTIILKRCSVKGCKKRELVAIKCVNCNQEYCLRHRLEIDHNCISKGNHGPFFKPFVKLNKLVIPNTNSSVHSNLSRKMLENYQGDLDEDAALAYAIALSMNEVPHSSGMNHEKKNKNKD